MWHMAIRENERAIKRAIRSAMAGAAEVYAATREVVLPADARDGIVAALRQTWRDAVRRGGAPLIGEFKDCYAHLETKAQDDLFEQIVDEYIRIYGGRAITLISDTTRKQVMALIDQGVKDGLGVDAIVKSIRGSIPGIASLRAHIIARTETHAASNYGAMGVAKASGRPLRKTWVSVHDHRTRDFGEGDRIVDMFNHRIMDGVTVGMDDPFMVPNKMASVDPLMFPGDPNGSAGNIILCRCVMQFRRVGGFIA